MYSKCININKIHSLLENQQFTFISAGAFLRKATTFEKTQKNYGTTLNEQCRKAYV